MLMILIFQKKGRERQATRMANLAENFNKKGFIVVADFICPTPDARKLLILTLLFG